MASVLIVDDSPTEVHVLKGVLTKLGHDAHHAQNGEIGVEMAAAIQPDLILMDVVMPGMNGFQATRQISKNPATSHIPVIIVTTKNQETDRVWGLRQGAKDYITKPIDESLLMQKIDALIG
ncbi:response regulator [Ectothiorhodospiraceae bacterium BW-2]|nr:response regulator [Ectothiorhodospiraceae bacterium BW-2]